MRFTSRRSHPIVLIPPWLYTTYKKAAKNAPATLSPIIGSRIPAAAGVAAAEVALPEARVAVPDSLSGLVPVVTDLVTVPVAVTLATVLVTVVAPELTVVVPARAELLLARALLMMLWTTSLAEFDGTGMATRVVLVTLGGGREVFRPTGMPDGPVGTKLAGVVTASG